MVHLESILTIKVIANNSKVPALDLRASFTEADSHKPIILLLSSGSDPLSAVQSFKPEKREERPSSFVALSLGQGQGPAAERSASLVNENFKYLFFKFLNIWLWVLYFQLLGVLRAVLSPLPISPVISCDLWWRDALKKDGNFSCCFQQLPTAILQQIVTSLDRPLRSMLLDKPWSICRSNIVKFQVNPGSSSYWRMGPSHELPPGDKMVKLFAFDTFMKLLTMCKHMHLFLLILYFITDIPRDSNLELYLEWAMSTATVLKLFKWTISCVFHIYFRSFSNKHYNFYNIQSAKCPSSIRWLGSNLQIASLVS